MQAINMKANYLTRPIGIDNVTPRLTWNASNGIKQTAYEIRTWKNEKPDWKSGKITTASMHAVYGGNAGSRDIITWQVRLYDEKEIPGEWSEGQTFEIGLLKRRDWTANWICGQNTDKEKRLPADYYRKGFAISGSVKKARLYATACGVYEAYLNGLRIGEDVLTPGSTEYEKRLYYQTYDVTGLLKEQNELDFIVGDGWFKGKLGCDGDEYFFGTQTKLLAQLEITYEDGSMQIIGTDDTFEWSDDGPVRYNDLKDGICVDQRKKLHFEKKAELTDYTVWPSASNAPAIREHEKFVPEVLKTPSGKTVLDFRQNMAGYVIFNRKWGAGQKITLRLGETLDHGEFTQENFATLPERGKSIDQKIEIISNGYDVPQYPKFFYSGFRYALVEGAEKVSTQDFTAVAVYSDITYNGSFCCSNKVLDQFISNTIWSEKSNFVDIPTDCPQREKGGWTGDAQVFQSTAMFFSDTAAFFRKWLKDIRDCQREDGRVDNICPRVQRPGEQDPLNGSTGWADAAVIIPYRLWKAYGDTSFITDNYELMHGWKEYVIRAASDKSIYQMPDMEPMKQLVAPFLLGDSPYSKYIIESGLHWGEWAEPEGVLETDGLQELLRPKQEENTAYLHYSMKLLAEMLEQIGKEEEAAQCREYSEGAKAAYQYYFVNENDIASKRQCKLVRPLALGLLEGETAENVAKRLADTAKSRDYKIGTGFLSTPYILPVLADAGHVETAYRMLENEQEPGWLAMVKQGATTVWEHYNGYDEGGHPLDTSYNHYSPGAVCGFLFEYTIGMRLIGERKFLLKPFPGGSLTYADAKWGSPYGQLSAKWRMEDTTFIYEVDVPANCEAEIVLPDGKIKQVPAGVWRFSCSSIS